MYNKESVYRWRAKNPAYKPNPTTRKRADVKINQKRHELLAELKHRPCTDCGGWFNPWQMDFDHLDRKTKLGHVSQMKGVKAIILESKKCEVVCSNCHREREHKRFKTSGGVYVQR